MRSDARWHASTFALLGTTPTISPTLVEQIEAAEASCSATMPGAVREWYCRDGAIDLLRQHRLDGDAIPLQEILTTFGQLHGNAAGLPQFRVLIAGEGCYKEWVVRLDASDDPPVLLGIDLGSPHGLEWTLAERHFSTFVFAWLWDDRLDPQRGGPYWLHAPHDRPLTDADLTYLRQTWHEGPVSVHPSGVTTRRFFDASGRIDVLSDAVTTDNASSAWTLHADDFDGLLRLVRAVCSCGTLSRTLEARTEAGQQVLRRLVEEQGGS